MAKFKIYASELVRHVIEIEAATEDEAYQKAWDDGDNWTMLDRLDWNLEDIERVTE